MRRIHTHVHLLSACCEARPSATYDASMLAGLIAAWMFVGQQLVRLETFGFLFLHSRWVSLAIQKVNRDRSGRLVIIWENIVRVAATLRGETHLRCFVLEQWMRFPAIFRNLNTMAISTRATRLRRTLYTLALRPQFPKQTS